jgi:hypothetical protein
MKTCAATTLRPPKRPCSDLRSSVMRALCSNPCGPVKPPVPQTWVGLLRRPPRHHCGAVSFLRLRPCGSSYGTTAPASQRPVDVRSDEGQNRCPLLHRDPVTLRCSTLSTGCQAPKNPVETPTAFNPRKLAPLQPSLPPVETINGRVEKMWWKLLSADTSTEIPSVFR